jgi:DnaA N-terminal domain
VKYYLHFPVVVAGKEKKMQETPKLNMKGRIGEITYFRNIPSEVVATIHRRYRDKEGNEQVAKYKLGKKAKVYFKEEHVLNFSLDTDGTALPDKDTDYVKIKNYLLYFWSPILGKEATYLYIILLSMCYGKEKDYCWPSMEWLEEMLPASRPSLMKYFKILEDHGLAYRFWTLIPENDNREDTPLIKVKKQVPYLPSDLYEKLGPITKVKHDEFILKYVKKYNVNLVPYVQPNFEERFDSFVSANGEVNDKVVQKQMELHTNKERLKELIPDEYHVVWNKVKEKLEKSFAKPTYDVYFKDSLFDGSNGEAIVYVPNMLARDRVEEIHSTLLLALLKEEEYFYESVSIKVYEG